MSERAAHDEAARAVSASLTWPALRLRFTGHEAPSRTPPPPLTSALLFTLDDFEPRAIDDRAGTTWLVFFASSELRDRARAALEAMPWRAELRVEGVDVPDEDWASRTQRELTAIRVGDIVVAPPWEASKGSIVIEPSMGFGTGHHESTRLCLTALQRLELAGRTVLDVGTGSGVLAIAAAMLGAGHVVAIDTDADAVASARHNVSRNRVGSRVTVQQAALGDPSLEASSVVVANLTGALLRREATACARLVSADGTLILSGFTSAETAIVAEAYSRLSLDAQLVENDWAALVCTKGLGG